MGNDIFPTTLPDAYRFLDDWKSRHREQGLFAGKGEGIALATGDAEEHEG